MIAEIKDVGSIVKLNRFLGKFDRKVRCKSG